MSSKELNGIAHLLSLSSRLLLIWTFVLESRLLCRRLTSLYLFVYFASLANLSVTDCGGDDLELKQEMEKQFVDLVTEELKLQEAVADEHSRHMNVTLGEAKRVASQYQKEAEKCNAATEICESARERAEALLIKERKITSLWEKRARQSGWEGE
ncbi:uncharacterized protein LOC103862025 isoform X1 [Brassica rapa]|uniref:uncharacterized protein LOC103862025 isoform X1 n=1 Tax=Brassica campestris TaxID=3711 RepID=UPI00142DD274|nr:uncharacterized protein LOC103862025 isoform X1 [Brassica rapa]